MGNSKLKLITAFSDNSLKHYIDGIVHKLENENIRRVASIDKGEQLINKIEINKPELIFIGTILKDMGGIEAVEIAKEVDPNSKVLFVSKYNSKLLEIKTFSLGADAYLTTNQSYGNCIRTIKEIINGKKLFTIEKEDLKKYTNGKYLVTGTEIRFLQSTLTAQQLRIFKMLGEGISNKEIADKLFI